MQLQIHFHFSFCRHFFFFFIFLVCLFFILYDVGRYNGSLLVVLRPSKICVTHYYLYVIDEKKTKNKKNSNSMKKKKNFKRSRVISRAVCRFVVKLLILLRRRCGQWCVLCVCAFCCYCYRLMFELSIICWTIDESGLNSNISMTSFVLYNVTKSISGQLILNRTMTTFYSFLFFSFHPFTSASNASADRNCQMTVEKNVVNYKDISAVYVSFRFHWHSAFVICNNTNWFGPR